MEGVGKSLALKITELQTNGSLAELNKLLGKTPNGVIEMLSIKGIGPKKVGQLWRELEVESIGELLYACNENRLIELKGFGEKTQAQVKKAIEFKMASAGKFHYYAAEIVADKIIAEIKIKHPAVLVSLTGAIRRKCEIIEIIDVLIAEKINTENFIKPENSIPVNFIFCDKDNFYDTLINTTATAEHLVLIDSFKASTKNKSEEAIYESLGMQYIEPELREGLNEVKLARNKNIPKLIEYKDLRGALHNHTKYSDGYNTLTEMAEECIKLGYEYFGVCDHSQSAFYASGMKPENVLKQFAEIEVLNKQLVPFKIFKGIESDILNDGRLDYDEEILKQFDFVVASVHSNLKMDEEKANTRLIKAIENPHTTILGHPTGRLLLSRQGYPVNHKKIIDACAANNVAIELNAHPYRLDIDWRWIPYCLEKNVKISINPDAHVKEGLLDMYYGVCAARKGMLTKEMCLNAMSLTEIEKYFTS
jgi:DNA polymerase (family 10)